MALEHPAKLRLQGPHAVLQELLLPCVQSSGDQVVLTTQLCNLGSRVERLQNDTDLLVCAPSCLLVSYVAFSPAALRSM